MDEMDGMDFMDPAWEQARACDGFLSIWSIMSIQSIQSIWSIMSIQSIWSMPSISSIFPKCHFPRRAERTR
jgi:hypothetical protein